MKIPFWTPLLFMIFATDVEARTISYCMPSEGAYAATLMDMLALIDEPNDQYRPAVRKDCYKHEVSDDLVIKKKRVAVVYGEKQVSYVIDMISYRPIKISKYIADAYQHGEKILADFYYSELRWADIPEYWAGVAEAKKKAAEREGLSPSDVDTTASADAKRGAEAYDRGDHVTAIRHYTAAIVSGTLSEYNQASWLKAHAPTFLPSYTVITP